MRYARMVKDAIGHAWHGHQLVFYFADVQRFKQERLKKQQTGPIVTKNRAEYSAWAAMQNRCANSDCRAYKYYGGRGIKVCGRWQGKQGFQNFLADMGPKPTPQYSLDRYPDNDGNYEPGNCRWATRKQQLRNKRNNRHLTFRGRTQCVTDWALELGMRKELIRDRLNRGWSVKRTLITPSRGRANVG